MHNILGTSDQFCLRHELSNPRRLLKAKIRPHDTNAKFTQAVDAFFEDLNASCDNWAGGGTREEQAQYEALRRIKASVAFIMQHLNQPLRVTVLSAKAGLSASHFHSLFKRATGFAPIDFLIRARLQRACQLLERTTLKIKEIAALLGYRDQYYFSRQFKTLKNIPPSEYRLKGFTPALVEQTSLLDFEKDVSRSFAVRNLRFQEGPGTTAQTVKPSPAKTKSSDSLRRCVSR